MEAIKCPKCGATGPFRYIEDIQCYREVKGIAHGGLTIEGLYKTGDGYDDGTNPRLQCRADIAGPDDDSHECLCEFEIPEEVRLNFV